MGGGADPPGGHQHTILSFFPKQCKISRIFWAAGACTGEGGPP